jgi:hypothetical protein
MPPLLMLMTALIGLAVAPVAVGLFLPRGHTVSRRVVIQQPREVIWGRIVDFASQTEWRPDVSRPVRLDDHNGHEVWRDTGDLALETVEAVPCERLVRRVMPNRMFGGTWTVTLRQAPGGTEVAVVEAGEVYHPLFRTVGRFLIGYDRTVNRYLIDLARSFGQAATPTEGTTHA